MSDRFADEVEAERHWKNCEPQEVAASLMGACPKPAIPVEDAREVAEFLARALLGQQQQMQLMAAELQGFNKVFFIAQMQHKHGAQPYQPAPFPTNSNGLSRAQRRGR